jgi:conjugal transfer pilus assembly protein TraD
LGQLPDLHYIAKLSGGRIVKGRLPVLRSSPVTGKA